MSDIHPGTLLLDLADDLDIRSMERARQEAAMRRLIATSPSVELIYITDAKGTQVTDNIAHEGFKAAYGTTGFGMAWSHRAWFFEPMRQGRMFLTDIYRSAATDRDCFTVACPIRGPQGEILGILAADVDLQTMLG